MYPIGWNWNRESIKQVELFKIRWEQTKMTREEAIKKLHSIQPKLGDPVMPTIAAAGFADGLEALGLIKFDPEPEIDLTMAKAICNARSYGGNREDTQHVFLNRLANAGYKVVKI